MKTILYILLGLSLGAGLTLIALQERFVRERRRLLAMVESQRAKAAQAVEDGNKKAVEDVRRQWEQESSQLQDELRACQARLAEAEARATNTMMAGQEPPDNSEQERLLQEKEAELSRLTAEITHLTGQLSRCQEETKTLSQQLNDLTQQNTALSQQVTALQAEIVTLEEARRTQDDDFLLLGPPGGHLLPGPVVRAFLKRQQSK